MVFTSHRTTLVFLIILLILTGSFLPGTSLYAGAPEKANSETLLSDIFGKWRVEDFKRVGDTTDATQASKHLGSRLLLARNKFHLKWDDEEIGCAVKKYEISKIKNSADHLSRYGISNLERYGLSARTVLSLNLFCRNNFHRFYYLPSKQRLVLFREGFVYIFHPLSGNVSIPGTKQINHVRINSELTFYNLQFSHPEPYILKAKTNYRYQSNQDKTIHFTVDGKNDGEPLNFSIRPGTIKPGKGTAVAFSYYEPSNQYYNTDRTFRPQTIELDHVLMKIYAVRPDTIDVRTFSFDSKMAFGKGVREVSHRSNKNSHNRFKNVYVKLKNSNQARIQLNYNYRSKHGLPIGINVFAMKNENRLLAWDSDPVVVRESGVGYATAELSYYRKVYSDTPEKTDQLLLQMISSDDGVFYEAVIDFPLVWGDDEKQFFYSDPYDRNKLKILDFKVLDEEPHSIKFRAKYEYNGEEKTWLDYRPIGAKDLALDQFHSNFWQLKPGIGVVETTMKYQTKNPQDGEHAPKKFTSPGIKFVPHMAPNSVYEFRATVPYGKDWVFKRFYEPSAELPDNPEVNKFKLRSVEQKKSNMVTVSIDYAYRSDHGKDLHAVLTLFKDGREVADAFSKNQVKRGEGTLYFNVYRDPENIEDTPVTNWLKVSLWVTGEEKINEIIFEREIDWR
jgi:hypothetical protein